MKNFKKITALLLAIMMVCVFAGCGTGTENKDNNSASDAIVMGTNASFPPYEYVDDNGKIVGIDAEIAEAIAGKLGKKLTIKDMDFDSLITAVAGGSVDMVLAGLTVTDERKEQVNFSDSYATGVQVIIVKEGSTIASVDDLEGKTIGVQSGTTGDIYCTDDYGQDFVKQFANGSLAVAALLKDQVDCVIIDNEPAKNYVAVNEGLKILDTEYIQEEYAIAVAKENNQLLEEINKAMSELKADGTIDKIISKYIKAE